MGSAGCLLPLLCEVLLPSVTGALLGRGGGAPMGTCFNEDLVGWFCRAVSISSKAASCCPRSAPGCLRFFAQSVTAPCPCRDSKPSRARQLPFENPQKVWWRLSCLQEAPEHSCCLLSLPFSSMVVRHVDNANCCPCVMVSDCEVCCEPVTVGTTPWHVR